MNIIAIIHAYRKVNPILKALNNYKKQYGKWPQTKFDLPTNLKWGLSEIHNGVESYKWYINYELMGKDAYIYYNGGSFSNIYVNGKCESTCWNPFK